MKCNRLATYATEQERSNSRRLDRKKETELRRDISEVLSFLCKRIK